MPVTITTWLVLVGFCVGFFTGLGWHFAGMFSRIRVGVLAQAALDDLAMQKIKAGDTVQIADGLASNFKTGRKGMVVRYLSKSQTQVLVQWEDVTKPEVVHCRLLSRVAG